MEMFRNLKGKPGEVVVTEDDKKVIDEVLTPYWAGRDYGTVSTGKSQKKRGS